MHFQLKVQNSQDLNRIDRNIDSKMKAFHHYETLIPYQKNKTYTYLAIRY